MGGGERRFEGGVEVELGEGVLGGKGGYEAEIFGFGGLVGLTVGFGVSIGFGKDVGDLVVDFWYFRRRDGEMERWRGEEMERWRDEEMERWRETETVLFG